MNLIQRIAQAIGQLAAQTIAPSLAKHAPPLRDRHPIWTGQKRPRADWVPVLSERRDGKAGFSRARRPAWLATEGYQVHKASCAWYRNDTVARIQGGKA